VTADGVLLLVAAMAEKLEFQLLKTLTVRYAIRLTRSRLGSANCAFPAFLAAAHLFFIANARRSNSSWMWCLTRE
jgi:hypothetical protein